MDFEHKRRKFLQLLDGVEPEFECDGITTLIADDMVTVFGLLANLNSYPDTLGYGEQFERIVAEWRSTLKKR